MTRMNVPSPPRLHVHTSNKTGYYLNYIDSYVDTIAFNEKRTHEYEPTRTNNIQFYAHNIDKNAKRQIRFILFYFHFKLINFIQISLQHIALNLSTYDR